VDKVNRFSKVTLTTSDITLLVNSQLITIEDALVRSTIENLLVSPFSQTRNLVGTEHLCWVVAEHTESGTGYLYCETAFGPSLVWGIVWLSDSEIGMDSGWFPTLGDAFYDSFAAAPLKIWNVVKRNSSDSDSVVASLLTSGEAFALIAKLNIAEGRNPHTWSVYHIVPRTRA
jgi:hypothetical protein